MRDRSNHVFRRFYDDFKEASFDALTLACIALPVVVFTTISCFIVGILQLFSTKELTFASISTNLLLIVCVFDFFVAAIVVWYIKHKYHNDTFTFNHPYGYRLGSRGLKGGRFKCVYDKSEISEIPISGEYCVESKFVNEHQTTKERWADCNWCVNGESLYGGDRVNLRNATKAEFLAAKRNGTLDDYKFTVVSKSGAEKPRICESEPTSDELHNTNDKLANESTGGCFKRVIAKYRWHIITMLALPIAAFNAVPAMWKGGMFFRGLAVVFVSAILVAFYGVWRSLSRMI